MLPGGSDLLYRSVLATAHRHYAVLEVWSGGATPRMLEVLEPGDDGGLTFFSASLRATLTSRVSRTLDFQVKEDLYPVDPTDLLAPFGNEIRAYLGVRLGDGSTAYSWQVFRGKIQTITQNSDGMCMVRCADRGAEVVENAFVTPQNSQPTNTVFDEFVRLVSDAVPDPSFGTSDFFSAPVQPLTWQYDRGQALDEMANAVGAFWYPLANGDFVMRRYPWTVAAAPVVVLTDQDGGTVNGWAVTRSRSNIYNQVTVTGERLNGDEPVFATVSDDEPSSPTFVGGNFGVRSLLDRLHTPSTQGAALSAANALLSDSIAPVESWSLEVVPDAAQELGDVVQVQVNGRNVTQVVSAFTLPLDLSGNMTIETRSLVINKLEV